MAKDPRFNFYPDNWDGGTEDFTLEQEGAYLRVIIMHSRKGRFTQNQAIDCLMRKTRGDAAACAGLWQFLMPKFCTDGKVFWSERLEKEVAKSAHHSKSQSERAKTRWAKNGIDSGSAAAYAPDMPVMEVELEIEEQNKKESFIQNFSLAFDERTIEGYILHFKGIDVMEQLQRYRLKCDNAPADYHSRDPAGLRSGFQYQLEHAKAKPNGTNLTRKQQHINRLVEDHEREYGSP